MLIETFCHVLVVHQKLLFHFVYRAIKFYNQVKSSVLTPQFQKKHKKDSIKIVRFQQSLSVHLQSKTSQKFRKKVVGFKDVCSHQTVVEWNSGHLNIL